MLRSRLERSDGYVEIDEEEKTEWGDRRLIEWMDGKGEDDGKEGEVVFT